MQENLLVLEKLTFDVGKINVARIDQAAIVTDKPVRPRRVLIVIMGVVAGLLGGILVAFVRNIETNNIKS